MIIIIIDEPETDEVVFVDPVVEPIPVVDDSQDVDDSPTPVVDDTTEKQAGEDRPTDGSS